MRWGTVHACTTMSQGYAGAHPNPTGTLFSSFRTGRGRWSHQGSVAQTGGAHICLPFLTRGAHEATLAAYEDSL